MRAGRWTECQHIRTHLEACRAELPRKGEFVLAIVADALLALRLGVVRQAAQVDESGGAPAAAIAHRRTARLIRLAVEANPAGIVGITRRRAAPARRA